jgi:hypothetical protein
MQQCAYRSATKKYRLRSEIPARRTIMKKTVLSIAAAAMISMAGGAGFAAELPAYQSAGLPISTMQAQVLGAANVGEQSVAPASAASPHQLNVLTPRAKTKLTSATVASRRAETGRSIR